MLVDTANVRRRPTTHVPDVRNDSRTRLQVGAQLLPQLQVRSRVQEEGDDGSGPDVRRIHVAEPELHFVLDTGLARFGSCLTDQGGIDLNPHATRAKRGCRGNRDAPVAGPEIGGQDPVGPRQPAPAARGRRASALARSERPGRESSRSRTATSNPRTSRRTIDFIVWRRSGPA